MNQYHNMERDVGLHTLLPREKPAANSPAKWIVGGTLAGCVLIGVLGVATWFHLKTRKEDKLALKRDQEELDDYGLGDSNDTDDIKWPSRDQSHVSGEGRAAGNNNRSAAGAADGSGENLMAGRSN